MRNQMINLLAVLLAAILVMGCGGSVAADETREVEPADDVGDTVVTEATPVPAGDTESVPAASDATSQVTWNQAPEAIIIQLREGGGFTAPPNGTELPQWTLYGDGQVIWTENGEVTPGFTRQVWVGTLSEEEISELLAFAGEAGFWELEPSYGTEPTESEGASGGATLGNVPAPDLPSSTTSITLTDRKHSVLVYPADLETQPESYRTFRDRLLSTRPNDATLYSPESFRLEAVSMGAQRDDDAANPAEWPYAEIALDEVVTSPLTLEGDRGREVGQFLISNGHVVVQDGQVYSLKLVSDPPRPVR